MMTATADLRSEHRGVVRMLEIMDRMSQASSRGQVLEIQDLEQVIEFLRVFVDKCHHAKEETLLFPALREAGIVAIDEVLTGLSDEHVRGRETVARLAATVQSARDGDSSAHQALAAIMTDYATLLRSHIRREEDDCFDVADSELPATVQRELESGYDRIEDEVVGNGVHEAFHALLDRLDVKTSEY